jgi:SAM-dependent methyltransferase
MSDSNNPFPSLYHCHHQNFIEDLPFWKTLARWQGDPILELGCGTGRVLIPLAQDGHTVYGIDNSPAMLAFLKQRIPNELEPRIHLLETDMIDFQIEAEFRLVLLPCNTYSSFEAQERSKLLTCVFQHLKPGGVFAVSMPNPNLLASLQTNAESEVETIFSHPVSGSPVQVSSNWEKRDDIVKINWNYDHLLPDGKIEHLATSVSHHLASMEDHITEMISVGFTIQDTYRNFKTGPYKPEASYLIIIAKK